MLYLHRKGLIFHYPTGEQASVKYLENQKAIP